MKFTDTDCVWRVVKWHVNCRARWDVNGQKHTQVNWQVRVRIYHHVNDQVRWYIYPIQAKIQREIKK